MGHTLRWRERSQGKLKPLAVTLPSCLVVMDLMLKHQALVCWALMETWDRLLYFSTILEIAITPALMATKAINASALLVFSLCGKCYMGRLSPEPNILPRDSACFYGFYARVVPCLAMPREQGKPHRGSTYYRRFGWHNHLAIASPAFMLG
jgi:hypothetical protein